MFRPPQNFDGGIHMLKKHNYDDTNKLLKLIAEHLSRREDCRRVEYEVTIEYGITISPSIYVFPDIHRRKKSDREYIIDHIIEHHFDKDENGDPKFALIAGVYKYELSSTKKSRRWRLIKSL